MKSKYDLLLKMHVEILVKILGKLREENLEREI